MSETNPSHAPEEPRDDSAQVPASDGGETDSLRELLDEAARERDQFRAMAQRAQADLVNYRRRVEDEQQTLKRNITSSLLIDMLELVDNFDRALEYVPDDAVAPQWLEGLQNARRGFDRKLALQGVIKVESAGQQFDPNFHDAIQSLETNDHPDGAITAVIREGYMLDGRLLRPAQVVVAVPPTPQDETETTN